MSDKSPHKGLTKGKSIKEKRADKKAKAAAKQPADPVAQAKKH